jgi:hypothetical protein
MRAVADPDSLADIVHTGRIARLVRALKPLECEDMLSSASEAYERVTGDPEAYWAALADAEREDAKQQPEHPDEPFDFDDEARCESGCPGCQCDC